MERRFTSPFLALCLALVARAQPGANDPTFNIWGQGLEPGQVLYSMVVQPDGRILIAGSFTKYDGITRKGIARLESNGLLDPTFDPGSGVVGDVFAMSVQTDGRVLVGGNFTSYNGTLCHGLLRLNSDGSADASFVPSIGNINNIKVVTVQADGKVLLGARDCSGSFTGAIGNKLARLNSDGSTDATFNQGIGYIDAVNSLTILPDGRMIVGGEFMYQADGTWHSSLARLNSDGSMDSTFTTPGTIGAVFATVLQPDGSLLTSSLSSRVARYDPDGSLDASFLNTGSDFGGDMDPWVNAIAVQPDGRIITAGRFQTCAGIARKRVARLHSDGSLDHAFDPGEGPDDEVNVIALQPDGGVLVGGWFGTVGGVQRYGIARLNSDNNQGVSTGLSGIGMDAFTLFPNPTDGPLTMRTNISGLLEVNIIDIAGRTVFARPMDRAGLNDQLIDLSAQPNGVYTIQLRSAQGVVTRRVVKR